MGKKICLFWTLLIFSQSIFAQKIYRKINSDAEKFYKKGTELYAQGDFREAAEIFSRAIKSDSGKVPLEYKYRTASAWSMAKQVDSAFVILFQISPYYKDLNHILGDSSFKNLQSDGRWGDLLKQINANKDISDRKVNVHLKLVLDTILNDDQDSRKKSFQVGQKFGMKSKNLEELNVLIAKKDSINIIKIKKIFKEYGWPDVNQIGEEGQIAIFLVIQHAKLEVQKELSGHIELAHQKGHIEPGWYATFLDKVAIGEGRCQVFGSQVRLDTLSGAYCVLPLIDVEDINNRRLKNGLNTIEEYLKYYSIDWGAEKMRLKMSSCK